MKKTNSDIFVLYHNTPALVVNRYDDYVTVKLHPDGDILYAQKSNIERIQFNKSNPNEFGMLDGIPVLVVNTYGNYVTVKHHPEGRSIPYIHKSNIERIEWD